MWIESILIGILIGILRGGRLGYLSRLHFKYLNIFVLSVIVQLIPSFLGRIEMIADWACEIYFFGYVLLLVFLLLNLAQKGMKLLLLGSAMNIVILLINNFKMPVYLNGVNSNVVKMKLSIKTGELVNYVPIEQISKFTDYFAKIIQMPEYYPGITVISIADIIISLGIIILIQDTVVSRKGFFV